jgi:palmitoyl-protein thioesterase
MLLTNAFALSTFFLSIHGVPLSQNADKPLPLVIWHGLGDSFEGEGIIEVAELAEAINPGTYTYLIRLGEDASSDRSATFFGNLTEQIQEVCDTLAADPILSAAPAIDALGFSQGGLFLRGYVERCNNPPVRSLVTFGSPHNGIVDFAGCKPTDWLCRGAMGLLKSNTWGSYVQGRLVPAQYYRTTDAETGEPSDDYLLYSNYLGDVNNERDMKNTAYAERLATLEKFVMYMFEDDTTVIPKESSWFANVNTETGDITPLKDRTLYKADWLGLQKLDKNGGLIFKTTPGGHMRLSDEVLNNTFKTYYGPASRTKSMTMGDINVEL